MIEQTVEVEGIQTGVALARGFAELAARSIVTGLPGGTVQAKRGDGSVAWVVLLILEPLPLELETVNVVTDMLEGRE